MFPCFCRTVDSEAGDGAAEERATELARQAERAHQLLTYQMQAGVEEEMVFNEGVYSRPSDSRQLLASLPTMLPLPAGLQQQYHAVAAAAAAPSQLAPAAPLQAGQEVSAEALDALRPLGGEQFVNLLTNFYRGLKGKYKVPIFAHQELDLRTVSACFSVGPGNCEYNHCPKHLCVAHVVCGYTGVLGRR